MIRHIDVHSFLSGLDPAFSTIYDFRFCNAKCWRAAVWLRHDGKRRSVAVKICQLVTTRRLATLSGVTRLLTVGPPALMSDGYCSFLNVL